MQPRALAASGVTVEFSGLRALLDVSLVVKRGEILGLIGPNGSGKTTLVNAITGQVALGTGRVEADGIDLTGAPPRDVALAGVARTFQIGRHFGKLTVLQNVAVAALSHRAGMQRALSDAQNLLAEFGLEGRAEDLVDELSYGEKRRVEVARALAGDPGYLLLDEPAAGMNTAETESLLEILAKLPDKRNLGLLIIDHDMGLIMRLCQRLHVLASGQTIAEGDVGSVREDPTVIEAYLGHEEVDA